MKSIQTLALSIAFAISSISALHARQYFKAFEGRQAPSTGKQLIVPGAYKIFAADNSGLQSFLQGLNNSPANGQMIQLPTPDGAYRTFRIWKNTLIPKQLQSRYPGIGTFTAEATDNPQVTAKIDFTGNGFHAMVFDGDKTFLIDPYANVPDGFYIVYYKNDYQRNLNRRMVCEVDNKDEIRDANGNLPEQIGGNLPRLAAKQFGTTQRTYRLALACTGEYAQVVGGATPTKTTVFAAMVTSMNRVNGIYERELGITMVFVEHEDTLIYINPNTDPFTANNNGGQLLGQNQQNTGDKIGVANYDIGHIFSTGGGGIANLGCVCASFNNNNYKAGGVTGSDNPVGDAYDVDYVAHEMGHQFGAEHTFNSNSGACGSGNGVAGAAYEPGSGATIMAYAGICGNDNLQQNGDAYFHAKSLDQMSDYVIGQGTCAVTNTGVSAPELPEIADTFYIPIGTPFELTAPLATADSTDTISYCWEQWNLGNFGQAESSAASYTTGPCFRSFTPVTDPVRVFPAIGNVISGTLSSKGMRMPGVSRALDFKVTARSIYQGFGTFNISDDKLRAQVVSTIGPFTVTSPGLATDAYKKDTTITVTWNVANTNTAPVSTDSVDIFLSVDGGFTYPFILASAVPNDGSQEVTLPDTATNQARVKVKGHGNIFFNISGANFKLYGDGLAIHDVIADNRISVYPNPAKDVVQVKNSTGAALNLVLYNVVGQRIWTGTMTQSAAIPVGTLSRGMYYLQMNELQSGAKLVKPITLQ